MPRSLLTPLAAFCAALAWSGAWITGKLAVTSAPALEISGRRLVGDILMLGGAMCWAVYTVLGTIALRDRSPLAVVTIAAPIGAVLLFPLGFLEKGYADVGTWGTDVWLNVLYLALAVSVASFILFYWI